MAQQTNETGYMAEISRADLADANGQRLDEIGAVLQRDRDNVHSGVAKDTGDEVDLWFKDASTRAEIAQMIDMLYIPEMTNVLSFNDWRKIITDDYWCPVKRGSTWPRLNAKQWNTTS